MDISDSYEERVSMPVNDTNQYRELWAKNIREDVAQFKKFLRKNAASDN